MIIGREEEIKKLNELYDNTNHSFGAYNEEVAELLSAWQGLKPKVNLADLLGENAEEVYDSVF